MKKQKGAKVDSGQQECNMEERKLNYDDVSIVPEAITEIDSRKQCNPFDENGMLPIFASPMDTVINEDNVKAFLENKINVIVPRNIPMEKRLKIAEDNQCFMAISLQEAIDAVDDYLNPRGPQGWLRTNGRYNICIDIANGHMTKLIDVCTKMKKLDGVFITLMAGNIANPITYKYYEAAGVDYVRCTVGSGSACLTASQTGIYYPVFSLIEEVYKIKQQIGGKCKIIADGGVKYYRDIQKALIFADYVMIGGLFNKTMESAGRTTFGRRYFNINGNKILRPITTLFTYGREIPRDKYDKYFKMFKENKLSIWKEYRGMSTKEAQRNIDKNAKLKTAEGKKFYQKVEYSINGWVENEIDYLRSAMSYTNSTTLSEYKGQRYVINNSVAYNK